jgi:hypothetical protein
MVLLFPMCPPFHCTVSIIIYDSQGAAFPERSLANVSGVAVKYTVPYCTAKPNGTRFASVT